MYLTAEDLRDIIRDGSGIEYMTEYTISYARFLLRSWGFTRKVPMGRHVKRASRQKIAWFRKKLGPLIEERTRAGYTACVQDEAICVADARFREVIRYYFSSLPTLLFRPVSVRLPVLPATTVFDLPIRTRRR